MILGLPCWLLLFRHKWSPWYWSLSEEAHYKVCSQCNSIRWRARAEKGNRAHDPNFQPIALADDGRPWGEYLVDRVRGPRH